MATGNLTAAQINAIYQELDNECTEYAREHGAVTAAQLNEMAARLMEAARNNPPARIGLSAVGPHGT